MDIVTHAWSRLSWSRMYGSMGGIPWFTDTRRAALTTHQGFLPEWEENPQNPQQNAMLKYINKTYELGRRLIKGPRHSSVHQARGDKFATGAIRPSTPRREKKPKARIKEINILQLNICGITKKKTELAKILHENKVYVALLQETLHSTTDLHITGYTSYAFGCTSCRGIATYVRNDLTADITNHQLMYRNVNCG
ncbi:hypothetical protein ElyMa_001860200 [Elysia marginata]|uniref:Endonuclease/exonuclease/phosphatase domain-containing protein n=1 Tax=Elysia marginata TaxID=1093978 RepID=A0AAV4EN26_9GAST|nr:hypothetical protein ElyMa_001860200 [Elysia marginata]